MRFKILLETKNKELEDLIITEYPGLLFPEQYSKKLVKEEKIYSFELDYFDFQKLLRRFPKINNLKYKIKPIDI